MLFHIFLYANGIQLIGNLVGKTFTFNILLVSSVKSVYFYFSNCKIKHSESMNDYS